MKTSYQRLFLTALGVLRLSMTENSYQNKKHANTVVIQYHSGRRRSKAYARHVDKNTKLAITPNEIKLVFSLRRGIAEFSKT